MIPGTVSKISEAPMALATTISPKSDLIRVTDTTSTTVVATIMPALAGVGNFLMIINQSGADITTVTTGNIQTAVTIGENVAVVAVYSKGLGKWVMGALA